MQFFFGKSCLFGQQTLCSCQFLSPTGSGGHCDVCNVHLENNHQDLKWRSQEVKNGMEMDSENGMKIGSAIWSENGQ